MELIEDLGMQYPLKNKGRAFHYATYKCPYCGIHFRCKVIDVNVGHTTSCGCYKKLVHSNQCKKTPLNLKHGMSKTTIYSLWAHIKARCYNKNNDEYSNYGGAGVIVCDEWLNDPAAFINWALAHGYKESILRIDRINTKGNYEPKNCRFVPPPISSQNTRLIMSTNTSGYRGVYWYKTPKKWGARIGYNCKNYFLGFFKSAKLAAIAYNKFVIDNKTAHPLNIID